MHMFHEDNIINFIKLILYNSNHKKINQLPKNFEYNSNPKKSIFNQGYKIGMFKLIFGL